MKFSKDTCKVLHLGWTNTWMSTNLSLPHWILALLKITWGSLTQLANRILGCINMKLIEDWGKECLFIQHLLDYLCNTVSNFGSLIAQPHMRHWSTVASLAGGSQDVKSQRSTPKKKFWGSWACSAWEKRRFKMNEEQPSRI